MSSDGKIIKNKVGLPKLSELPIARTATVTTGTTLPASPNIFSFASGFGVGTRPL